MGKRIDIEVLLRHLKNRPLIDVRTPAEFAAGHIPGAFNLPLFSNEERAVVGTAYKQESPEEAMLKGLEFVGPKMRRFVERAREMAPGGHLMAHCWRGGRRSESMAWLLGLAGFEVWTLEGGYKAYRNYLLNAFSECSLNLLILGGYTGSGKTEVLNALADRGEQVIDLERLARHKGSAFGALGEEGQPSVEQFENDLFEALRKVDNRRRVWVEDESQSIGRVYVPQGFWQKMRAAPLLVLDVPRAERIRYLVDGYARFDQDHLAGAFVRIQKRLGGQHLKEALSALEKYDYEKAAAIALKYYDKTYLFGLEKRSGVKRVDVKAPAIRPDEIADRLLRLVDERLPV